MASLLKKTFAVVLAIGLVISCFTVSAADVVPAITVTSAYVSADASSATVDIYTENFNSVYGSQFTVTLPEKYGVSSIVNNVEGYLDWEENSNYVVESNVIKFLDVRTSKGFNVTVNVTVPGNATGINPITVSDTYFIDSNEAECEDFDINTGVISIATAVEVPEGEEKTVTAQDGYFIPYGEVMVGEEYVNKENNGSFIVNGNTTYTQIKLPSEEVGVTTFGNGEKQQDNFGPAGIQFGSYAINAAGKKFGTLAVKGDLADFKAYCTSTLNMTDADIYNKLVELYNTNGSNGKSIGVKYGEGKKISVLCIAQRKYMWFSKVDDVIEHLQYAARITNPEEDKTYSAIAYSSINGEYTFSKEIADLVK